MIGWFGRFSRLRMEPVRARVLARLERKLGVTFRDKDLLNQSLAHRSYLQTPDAESVSRDNETLEFLGDAVLGLVISEELYRRFPTAEVGELAKIKSQVVSRATMGEIALEWNLDEWMLLGPGEVQRGEGKRPSVVGSGLEAVLGALYLDQGLAVTARLIRKLFKGQIQSVHTGESAADYKSLLQEYALRYFKATPEYRVVSEQGPSHQRRFRVTVGWGGKVYGTGEGTSKKGASQEAARIGLENLLAPSPE